MANDWASRQAAADLAAERVRLLELEKNSRDAAIMDERGPELFAELYAYIMAQTDAYNEKTGKDVFDVQIPRQTAGSPQAFNVLRKDGTRQPLKVTYNRASHRIRCESGAAPGEFILRVGPDGEARFESPYHQAYSIQELGDEVLTRWKSSQI